MMNHSTTSTSFGLLSKDCFQFLIFFLSTVYVAIPKKGITASSRHGPFSSWDDCEKTALVHVINCK